MENTREQLPVKVVDRLLGGACRVRVALAEHPVTGEVAPCVPIMDYADVFSYPKQAIFQMIDRSEWLNKHSVVNVMMATDGKYYSTRCIFEESMLGVFMKLQPKRCKDPDVARKVNDLQEEMVLILRDVLRGYRPKPGYCDEEKGLLPRPGLSASAIPSLCRQANKGCRFSARALSQFYGMLVEDLVEDVFTADPETSETAFLIARYLHELMEEPKSAPGVERTADGLTGATRAFMPAFEAVSRARALPRFFTNTYTFGAAIARERDALEALGWRKEHVKKTGGENVYRFRRIGMN
ncbi:MAG: hypothetical protein ACE5GY_08570 [Thermodesulfobacteriota bacterium]